MSKKGVKINLAVNKDGLCFNFHRNGKLLAQSSMTLEEANTADYNYIFYWLLNAAKDLFAQMPVPDIPPINAVCYKDVWEKIGQAVNAVGVILMNTNRFLNANAHLKNKASAYEKILFYNISEDERTISFYNICNEMNPGHFLYRNMELGWDANSRSFDRDKLKYLAPDDLVKLIIDENIRKIVTLNKYYPENVFCHNHININSVLAFMGVELVTIDVDSYNTMPYGYMYKAALSYSGFQEFAVVPTLEKFQDEQHKLKHVYYVAAPQDYGDIDGAFDIDADYSVVVLSQSRFPSVAPVIYPLLYLFDSLDEERLFTDLQLWWLSLQWMILHDKTLNEVERRNYDNRLFCFFYNCCISFLKYVIIGSIKTDRKVLLYGDSYWETLFPEYYQKKFLNKQEKDELFSKKSSLLLLMNISLNYPEAHASVNDSLMRKVPFITSSPIVRTPPYSGFRHIEYNNATELNSLINDVSANLKNAELKQSVRNYKDLMKASVAETAENILFDKKLPEDGGNYLKECEENSAIMNEMVQEYIKGKGAFLKASFDTMFKGSTSFNPSLTNYFGKRYVQRILAAGG